MGTSPGETTLVAAAVAQSAKCPECSINASTIANDNATVNVKVTIIASASATAKASGNSPSIPSGPANRNFAPTYVTSKRCNGADVSSIPSHSIGVGTNPSQATCGSGKGKRMYADIIACIGLVAKK